MVWVEAHGLQYSFVTRVCVYVLLFFVLFQLVLRNCPVFCIACVYCMCVLLLQLSPALCFEYRTWCDWLHACICMLQQLNIPAAAQALHANDHQRTQHACALLFLL